MSLSLVIFDLDGTLIDSAADLAHAVNGVLADLGAAPLTIPAVRAMIGDGTT
ncbi:phosphoglycolate phosphatase, partial [mine drainage metagenome]